MYNFDVYQSKCLIVRCNISLEIYNFVLFICEKPLKKIKASIHSWISHYYLRLWCQKNEKTYNRNSCILYSNRNIFQ